MRKLSPRRKEDDEKSREAFGSPQEIEGRLIKRKKLPENLNIFQICLCWQESKADFVCFPNCKQAYIPQHLFLASLTPLFPIYDDGDDDDNNIDNNNRAAMSWIENTRNILW